MGVGDEKKCESCIKHILSHKEHLTGVALSGVSPDAEESCRMSPGQLDSVFKKVGVGTATDLD